MFVYINDASKLYGQYAETWAFVIFFTTVDTREIHHRKNMECSESTMETLILDILICWKFCDFNAIRSCSSWTTYAMFEIKDIR